MNVLIQDKIVSKGGTFRSFRVINHDLVGGIDMGWGVVYKREELRFMTDKRYICLRGRSLSGNDLPTVGYRISYIGDDLYELSRVRMELEEQYAGWDPKNPHHSGLIETHIKTVMVSTIHKVQRAQLRLNKRLNSAQHK